MESLYLLVPLSVALVFVIGIVFWLALAGGQFDDLERPAHSVFEDEDDFPTQDARDAAAARTRAGP